MKTEEAKRIAMGLRTDFKCESDTMVDFCNTIIKALEQQPCKDAISKKELYQALYDHFHDEDAPNNTTEVTLGAVRNFVKDFPPVTLPTPQPMKEKWQELKETIIEMRDNNGTGTQQETCRFLANLMDVLEKQMEEKESEDNK